MPARRSRYVRVKVDFVLHFEEMMDSLPPGLHEVVDGTCHAAFLKTIEKMPVKPIGFSDGHVFYGLFFPKGIKQEDLSTVATDALKATSKKKRRR